MIQHQLHQVKRTLQICFINFSVTVRLPLLACLATGFTLSDESERSWVSSSSRPPTLPFPSVLMGRSSFSESARGPRILLRVNSESLQTQNLRKIRNNNHFHPRNPGESNSENSNRMRRMKACSQPCTCCEEGLGFILIKTKAHTDFAIENRITLSTECLKIQLRKIRRRTEHLTNRSLKPNGLLLSGIAQVVLPTHNGPGNQIAAHHKKQSIFCQVEKSVSKRVSTQRRKS